MMGKDFSKTRIPEVRKAEINSYITEIYTHKQKIKYCIYMGLQKKHPGS